MNTFLLSGFGFFYGLLIILVTFMPFELPIFNYAPLVLIGFLIVVNRCQIKKGVILIVMIYIAFMLLSNLFAQGDVRFVAVAGSLSMIFLSFKTPFRKNIESIILNCSLIIAVFIMIGFILLSKWQEGAYFIRDRFWLSQYINGWPNYTAMILATGMFVAYFKRSWIYLILLFIALFLTTSRLFYEATVFLMIHELLLNRMPFYKKMFYIVLLIVIVASIYNVIGSHGAYINGRLLAGEDRHRLYQAILERSFANIGTLILGIGNVLYKDLPYNLQSAHNSYLNILYRNGFICLLSFLVLLWVRFKQAHMEGGFGLKAWYMIFFMVASLFNNYFFNATTFTLLIVILNSPSSNCVYSIKKVLSKDSISFS